MPRKRSTLLHRGYLYAQEHLPASVALFDRVTSENTSQKRMTVAEAWKAGYQSSQRDARARKAKKPKP